jgi:plasmid stabilization system protein ParE
MILVILDAAEKELQEVFAYYEKQREGLGHRFLAEFRNASERIESFPECCQKLLGEVRVCKLSKFPYGLFYSVGSRHVIIQAIIHLHRSRRYWKRRLKE